MKRRNYCPVCNTRISRDNNVLVDRIDSFYVQFFKREFILDLKIKELHVKHYEEIICPLCKENLVVFHYETKKSENSPCDYIETTL